MLIAANMTQKLSVLLIFLFAITACEIDVSTRDGDDETADEFVARINSELKEINKELGAAQWVRVTYINEDTAILNSLANERHAEWHSRSVAESLNYE